MHNNQTQQILYYIVRGQGNAFFVEKEDLWEAGMEQEGYGEYFFDQFQQEQMGHFETKEDSHKQNNNMNVFLAIKREYIDEGMDEKGQVEVEI